MWRLVPRVVLASLFLPPTSIRAQQSFSTVVSYVGSPRWLGYSDPRSENFAHQNTAASSGYRKRGGCFNDYELLKMAETSWKKVGLDQEQRSFNDEGAKTNTFADTVRRDGV
jgi:hypothetical protein